MYSAYKLNKQGDNIQPWRTPFPIWNQSVVPSPVPTVAFWPAYRFLKMFTYADDTTLTAESEELKSLLRKVKESGKIGLKLNFQKTKIMASSPITSWQIDGEKIETETDFILLGSKITVDGDYSHEIKRRLLLGRKAMKNLESMLKSRVSNGFSSSHVWYENWTIKKVEHWGTDVFEL